MAESRTGAGNTEDKPEVSIMPENKEVLKKGRKEGK